MPTIPDEEARRITDNAVVRAREKGCTCPNPEVWFMSPDDGRTWMAQVLDHETCSSIDETDNEDDEAAQDDPASKDDE